MSEKVVFVPVNADQSVCPHFGKAHYAATCRVVDGRIEDWQEHVVDWDTLHDSGEGNHHARIVRFMRENGITHVIGGGMGEPMQNTLTKLGLELRLGIAGDAREAAAALG